MAKFLLTQDVIQKLYDAGLIAEKPEYVRRVVFDLEAGEIGRMYIEKFADDAFLDVLIDAREDGLKVIPPLLRPDEIGPDDLPQRVGMHMRRGARNQESRPNS